MLSKIEIQNLRDHLKNDPFNWPAHQLMNHITELEEQAAKITKQK